MRGLTLEPDRNKFAAFVAVYQTREYDATLPEFDSILFRRLHPRLSLIAETGILFPRLFFESCAESACHTLSGYNR